MEENTPGSSSRPTVARSHNADAVSPTTPRQSPMGSGSSSHRGYTPYMPRRASYDPLSPHARGRAATFAFDDEELNNWRVLKDAVETKAATLEQSKHNTLSVSDIKPRQDSQATVRPMNIRRVITDSDGGPSLLSSSPGRLNGLPEGAESPGGPTNSVPGHSRMGTGHSSGRSSLWSNQPSEEEKDEIAAPKTSKWHPSPVWVAVLKCAVAYFIASLFTFVPVLAGLLSTTSETDAHGRVTPRPAYSAHMVATVVVYFNPAKTLGNMVLASRFCLILALFAMIISLLAMGTVELFDLFSPSHGSKWDWISEIGDWVVCILWIGGSMGFLNWAKVWVNNPSFNSGCSMAAVTLYTVVIKEGRIPKLLEVLLIVFFGAFISNVCCFVIFPTSATTRLHSSIGLSLRSFSTLLELLTSTFLLKRTVVRQSHTSLKDAVSSYESAFKILQTDLSDAKHERVLDGRMRGKKLELYEAAVLSLARLAQHLAGLRSSTRIQEEVIERFKEHGIELDVEPSDSLLASVNIGRADNPASPEELFSSVRLLKSFRDLAGGPMDTLVEACEDAFEALQTISGRSGWTTEVFEAKRTDLATKLKKFNQSSSRAIKQLYAGPKRDKEIYKDGQDSSDDETPLVDARDAITTEGPNETVFLIYFFLFTLEEFARELLFLLDTFTEILAAEPAPIMTHLRAIWPPTRGRKEPRKEYLYKQLLNVLPVDPSKTQPPLFPRNAPKEQKLPSIGARHLLSVLDRVRQTIWSIGAFLQEPDMRYAIKTGLGGAILAAPAYIEAGRPIFLEYRGEWALIAYMTALSQTVGQTNFLSVLRIAGTAVGGLVAVGVYHLSRESPVILAIFGFFFSMPCFYIITQYPDYSAAGRFILLTYNLSALYAYNSREREISVEWIALHRSLSVVIGVLWAAFVSRYWWPFTARRELRMSISDFCLDLSYLYSKLVTTYSRGVDIQEPSPSTTVDEHEPLLPIGQPRYPHLNSSVRQFLAMELHLQSQLVKMRALLKQTVNEPRLKGPFAYGFYREVLLSCERMLDRLHSMRCVTTRDEWDNGIREAFVRPVNRFRREMAGNVILYFYTLSAGFRLRTPMPPYLPPAEHARQRLVNAIRELDVVKRRSVRGGGRHLLFFAYALAMQEVIAELEYLGSLMQEAFGVISQSTVVDFEALFVGQETLNPS